MNRNVWRLLHPADGELRAAWEGLVEGAGALGGMDRIAKAYGPEAARFASLQKELGQRSKQRFPDGRIRFWTSKGLEQATPGAVADYRAKRFAQCPSAPGERNHSHPIVWDACCGVGADAVALMRTMPLVLATDLDGDTLRCASLNLSSEARAAGGAEFLALEADALVPPMDEEAMARTFLLMDPDRRPDQSPGGKDREGDPERWNPALSAALDVASRARGACFKLPPGLDPGEVGIGMGPQEHLEWISLGGEMKELTLWTGALARPLAGRGGAPRTATALSLRGAAPTHYGGHPDPEAMPEPLEVGELQPGQFLVELGPALWQSDLAGPYASQHGLRPIGAESKGMFLVAQEPPEISSLVRAWPVLDACPADRRGVRTMLRPHGIGPLTVKKRQHPKTSLELEKELRGSGDKHGTLAVFRVPKAGSRLQKGRSLAVLLGSPLPGS